MTIKALIVPSMGIAYVIDPVKQIPVEAHKLNIVTCVHIEDLSFECEDGHVENMYSATPHAALGMGERRVENIPVIVVFDERRCRVCGCSDYNACPGGCSWVEPNLCSKCKDTTSRVDGANTDE